MTKIKKKAGRKISCILLALCMVLTLMPTAVFAEDTAPDLNLLGDSVNWDESSNNVDEDGNGYTLSVVDGVKTLTLKNTEIGTLTVPGSIIVKIDGNVTVNTINIKDSNESTTIIEGNDSSAELKVHGTLFFDYGALTLKNLYVEGDCVIYTGGRGAFTLEDAELTFKGISYVCVSGEGDYGLVLNNSKLTVQGTTDSPSQLFADKITMDTKSVLVLSNSNISGYGNITDGLSGLAEFLPEGYEIGTKYGSETILEAGTDEYAYNLVLWARPDIKFDVNVKGDSAPSGTEFELEFFTNSTLAGTTKIDLIEGSVKTDVTGSKDYENNKLTYDDSGASKILDYLSDGNAVYVRQKTLDDSNWTVDDTVYYIAFEQDTSSGGGDGDAPSTVAFEEIEPGNTGDTTKLAIYKTELKGSEYGATGDSLQKMSFENKYGEDSGGSGSHRVIYTVEFDSNGGSDVPEKKLSGITDKVIEGVENPTFAGKQFESWTYDGKVVSEDSTFFDLTGALAPYSITLTAQWVDEEQTAPPVDDENNDKPTDSDKYVDKTSGNKEKADASVSEVPKTGDGINLSFWVTIILAAGAAFAGMGIYRRKNDNKAE